ncbi:MULTISPECIES: ExbD/TolR family protein [Burkholderia]|uniref:Biopolymer transport protein ExbD/TolR n=2 Tax=Burkholderia TaxID=32008 RepID=A0A0B6S975_BURPL|nr:MULTISPECIES: biopolymer transporter ExbD [Burkholderia]ACR32550.1 Biopolymer transport protein ExbD/TolR [Burkholderia glumae BGR1]AJK50979.1 biopolymer transport protein ExbD/TolR [Burkholderia plantarii]AJY63708.1 biopolymer transport ExbD/TolR family protein [Burkholderia glumae LMG 2196 = ATCC 33617]ALK35117.1 Biopolymer transport protein ExbD/TolR [Burkholderia plantarii]KHJ60213.1 biopolymer transporter ExbD [Burkholderia glumae]
MGMNVSSRSGGEPEVMVDINTTPLIDVMLVLLIMLIITIPIQMHSVKMDLPVGNPPPPPTPPEIVQIDIDFDGTTTWNGAPVPNRAALEAKLQQAAAEPVQPEIHLRPNKLVPYRDVAGVLAAAQRVGATKIGLIGNEQYMQ